MKGSKASCRRNERFHDRKRACAKEYLPCECFCLKRFDPSLLDLKGVGAQTPTAME